MEIHNNYELYIKKPDDSAIKPSGYSPSFKGLDPASTLNLAGGIMQAIEDKGFLASFLIQDVLGMTFPRVGAAFLRDKEITGEYNTQEGLEVLGREGLTGPCMMAVAPLAFAISARFGKSTGMNSQLIKRFGESLKDFVSKPNFKKELLKDKTKFKEEFLKENIKDILANTVGKENVTEDSIKYILGEIKKYENIPSDANVKGLFGKSKYRKARISTITEHINNIIYKNSDNLNSLNNVKVGTKELKNISEYSVKDAITGLIKYSDDAVAFNKNLETLDKNSAEKLKDISLAKRFITNISTMAATLGVLSILPKIYAKSSVAPGAKTAMQLKEKQKNDNLTEKEENNNISFKGKINKPQGKKGLLEKLGKFLSKKADKHEALSSELEYNGHNFTNALMAGLSLFGLLTPRGLRAYNRAQVDENTGKKDLTELYEILIRDISSSLAVVFAVPMLTRALVSSYEKATGFVLINKDRSKPKSKQFIDLINPFSSAKVLKNSEMNAIYNGIDSKDKMLNFCKYIDKNNGDLEKILSKSSNSNLLKEKGLDLNTISKLKSKQEKNKQITEFIKKLDGDADKLITKVMKNAKNPSSNKILSYARGLNSAPAAIITFFVSPYLLGWFIPRLTYANTRRIHEKREKETKQKINSTV